MATLTTEQLVELRQMLARSSTTVTWTKTQVSAAMQALENDWNTFLTRANTDIETAVPGVFTIPQKALILRTFLAQKVRRDGG